jgi:hypothetical protein
MIRTFYRFLLWLHPPRFRREFAVEMLWIFDQAAESQGAFALLWDGLSSLARQWLVRSGSWKVAVALTLAVAQVGIGALALARLGPRHLARLAADSVPFTVSTSGPLAHQPLTIGMLMYLAVFVVGGLAVLTIGLTYWVKSFGTRRRPVALRVR